MTEYPVISIPYTSIDFTLVFEGEAFSDIYPSFALRSVLGKWLKTMHCISRGTPCDQCPFRKTCSYAFIFESPIEKNNEVLTGRDHSSHPFRIVSDARQGQGLSKLYFRIQLFGKAIEYVPHVVFAIREAGNGGLFRQRMRYTIEVVEAGGETLLHDDRLLLDRIVSRDAVSSSTNVVEERMVTVRFNTPVRFKTAGTYSGSFSPDALMDACKRRIVTLQGFYGNDALGQTGNTGQPISERRLFEVARNTQWVDHVHWSGRQQSAMKLGGVVGTFLFKGSAPQFDWAALSLCGLLGAGKNTSFGYGDISVHFDRK